MAKEYFKSLDLEYTEHDVFQDEQARQEMLDKTGQMGVPVIVIDEQVVIGYDKPKIDELLKAGGTELKKVA
jgi:glutaredoxin